MKYHSTPGAIPYRKGIFQEDMEYKSLTILDMSEKDKKYVLKQLIKINTQIDAEGFCYNMIQNSILNWSYHKADLHGRIGILKYKGIEVALFIERQLTKKRIDPEHPISEAKLKDPQDAWMRFDLFGLSAKQSRQPTTKLINDLGKQVESLEQKLATQIAINEQLEAGAKRHAKKNKHKKERREAKISRKDHKTSRRKKSSRHSKTIKRSSKSRR